VAAQAKILEVYQGRAGETLKPYALQAKKKHPDKPIGKETIKKFLEP
jgi:hypothetical protein